eukprot:11155775-Lingulodinium_polyedra.AAC.1
MWSRVGQPRVSVMRVAFRARGLSGPTGICGRPCAALPSPRGWVIFGSPKFWVAPPKDISVGR